MKPISLLQVLDFVWQGIPVELFGSLNNAGVPFFSQELSRELQAIIFLLDDHSR